jgi:hypothetical protein
MITRRRLSNADYETLSDSVIGLASQFQPIGVRGLFYQCVGAGLIEKTEHGYDRIWRITKEARLSGAMPFEWITDSSRRADEVSTFADIEELISAALGSFRLNPWLDQENYVQCWIEKEGLAPIASAATRPLRVPLYPGKGYSSLSFTREGALAALDAISDGKRAIVLQWGDYDPSGVGISESLADHYRIHGAGDAEVKRIGLKAEHIEQWNLPTRPTKASDSRAKGFGDDRSVELDAIKPQQLKEWIDAEIRGYIDPAIWQASRAEEDRQAAELREMIGGSR